LVDEFRGLDHAYRTLQGSRTEIGVPGAKAFTLKALLQQQEF
jgi:hypothetical protein